MTLKITPDECRVLERGLHVSTRCPKDAIDDAMIAVRALQAVLANGDEIIVQCTTHDRNTVTSGGGWSTPRPRPMRWTSPTNARRAPTRRSPTT
jgi:hypothetical protein